MTNDMGFEGEPDDDIGPVDNDDVEQDDEEGSDASVHEVMNPGRFKGRPEKQAPDDSSKDVGD
jgi:hypothetical protein